MRRQQYEAELAMPRSYSGQMLDTPQQTSPSLRKGQHTADRLTAAGSDPVYTNS